MPDNVSRPVPLFKMLPPLEMIGVMVRSLVASDPRATLKVANEPFKLNAFAPLVVMSPMLFLAPPFVVKVLPVPLVK